jgi:HPt (histidine-containing phosphotransfer) domain-containing protein
MPTDPEQPDATVAVDLAQQKTAALLDQLWQKNRPILADRIAILQRAASQLNNSHLHDDLHAEALSVAHKLAGTLGMFGLQTGTDAARQLEQLLDSPQPDAAEFSLHLSRLIEVVATKDNQS